MKKKPITKKCLLNALDTKEMLMNEISKIHKAQTQDLKYLIQITKKLTRNLKKISEGLVLHGSE